MLLYDKSHSLNNILDGSKTIEEIVQRGSEVVQIRWFRDYSEMIHGWLRYEYVSEVVQTWFRNYSGSEMVQRYYVL